MKKLKRIVFIFIFTILILLCSCNNNDLEETKVMLSIYVEDELVEEREVIKGSKIDFELEDNQYLFLGWFDIDGINSLNGMTVNEDMDIFAKTVAYGTEYKITYHMNKEANFRGNNYPKKYIVGDTTDLVAPIRSYNYEFVGWKLNGEIITQISDTMYGDIHLYDEWADHNIYHTIAYHVDGDVTYSGELKETLMEGIAYTIPYPIKDGYFFRGWYKDSNYTERVYTIEKENKEDYNLYAKFEVKTAKDTYVSFVGDSISTYDGLIPAGAGAYYPTYVNFPKEKTYFLLTCSEMGYNFLKNDSWGGGRLSSDNHTGGVVVPAALTDSRIAGLTDGIHDPDILIVHLGTNEYSQGISASTFQVSIQKYVTKIRTLYDDCEIYFCLHPCNGYNETFTPKREEYNKIIIEESQPDKSNYKVIDLTKCWDSSNWRDYIYANSHPNEAGFRKMADVIVATLKETHDYE